MNWCGRTFFEILRDGFFANIPYDIQLTHEKYYQTLFHTVFILLNLRISAEERTNLGRIDHVIELGDRVFFFEFKMSGSPEEALGQIEEKQYVQKYNATGKKVICVGVVFADRNIEAWTVKRRK
ncbi:MAG: PD-(D/E)XK nuclease domain-containing protein [Acidobacteriota bacterium]|nr:PD-(D/E)XK nuclease domain-containing protein [Acidobacteriota bacterium]